MTTFTEIAFLLQNDLVKLKQLEGEGNLLWIQRTFLEQKVGRTCYRAEEYLDGAELFCLKQLLAINDRVWQRFKRQFVRSVIIDGGHR